LKDPPERILVCSEHPKTEVSPELGRILTFQHVPLSQKADQGLARVTSESLPECEWLVCIVSFFLFFPPHNWRDCNHHASPREGISVIVIIVVESSRHRAPSQNWFNRRRGRSNILKHQTSWLLYLALVNCFTCLSEGEEFQERNFTSTRLVNEKVKCPTLLPKTRRRGFRIGPHGACSSCEFNFSQFIYFSDKTRNNSCYVIV
jgi:hypothetical protein